MAGAQTQHVLKEPRKAFHVEGCEPQVGHTKIAQAVLQVWRLLQAQRIPDTFRLGHCVQLCFDPLRLLDEEEGLHPVSSPIAVAQVVSNLVGPDVAIAAKNKLRHEVKLQAVVHLQEALMIEAEVARTEKVDVAAAKAKIPGVNVKGRRHQKDVEMHGKQGEKAQPNCRHKGYHQQHRCHILSRGRKMRQALGERGGCHLLLRGHQESLQPGLAPQPPGLQHEGAIHVLEPRANLPNA
mmetsp:Transcript_74652/g.178080  ORF Transcript_74652/g.178080 Transcript_74652/m.178080 type:complete len:238 (-) Transcript_74652:109-822(-)